jgi:hypothetical protein
MFASVIWSFGIDITMTIVIAMTTSTTSYLE